ncbi:MAG: helix-turn-helix domain-containing protein [Candidatus ainarchaeum sp.]|nr:helix-turn-helix domain-containing protein [Candidatus ainarchaeum sp.]
MDSSALKRIGLKEKEAEVYLALLKQGPSLANQIARKTRIVRSSVYDYLDILIGRGFVSYSIISGKKFFQAVSPEKIFDNFIEEKKNQESALNLLVAEMLKLKNKEEKKVTVEVFEGKEGLKSAMSLAIKEKPKEVLVYGTAGASHKILPFFMEHWHKQRAKQGTLLRVIYNNVTNSFERIAKGPKLQLAKVRISPIKNFSLIGTIISRERVLLTVWDAETPIGILIQSKEMWKSYKDNFEILWSAASKHKGK